MTAATPGREELLAWADECQAAMDAGGFSAAEKRKATAVVAALRLAAKPDDEGTIPVPKIALDWLNGEAPDVDGKWFGESIPQSDVSPKRAYWWRSKFRSMIPALVSTTGEPKAMRRASTIVISDWLANCRTEQWTPFEAATALKAALAKEGYEIVESTPQPAPKHIRHRGRDGHLSDEELQAKYRINAIGFWKT